MKSSLHKDRLLELGQIYVAVSAVVLHGHDDEVPAEVSRVVSADGNSVAEACQGRGDGEVNSCILVEHVIQNCWVGRGEQIAPDQRNVAALDATALVGYLGLVM